MNITAGFLFTPFALRALPPNAGGNAPQAPNLGEEEMEIAMTKENWLQVVAGALVILLVLAVAAGQATAQSGYQLAALIVGAFLVLALIALGAERATELLKMVLRFMFGSIPLLNKLPFLQPNGAGSAFLALIVSLLGIQNFDVTILDEFTIFKGVDPQLVMLITVAVTWIGSSIWHSLLPDNVGKAQAIK